jgi:small subunit ribosomal protein S5
MRAVFETLGVQDVVSKSIGSSSPYNMVRATFDGLQNIQSPRNIAARRGLKVSSIFGNKNIANKAKDVEEQTTDV